MTLSQQAQVLCVTHQPQVAARADHHLRIQKDIKTHCSEARLLSMEERTFEVGRMISNAEPSDSALQHAKHLLKRSSGFKTAAA
jgi:DNA repair protein RecN (Recombination protein N)